MIRQKLSYVVERVKTAQSLIRSSDLRYVNKFDCEEIVFPINTVDFHLSKAIIGLMNFRLPCGGFSNKYDFTVGAFGPMYPETTGYTIGTLLNLAVLEFEGKQYKSQAFEEYARQAIESLIPYQLMGGGFTGGRQGMSNFGKPSLFNSGQIALGLADYYQLRPNDKLIDVMEKLGVFFKNALQNGVLSKNFCFRGRDSSYYTRAIWGAGRLFQAMGDNAGCELVQATSEKLISRASADGRISKWGFSDDFSVLHTVIYTLRGFWELGELYDNDQYKLVAINGMKWLETSGSKVQVGSRKVSASFPEEISGELCLTGLAQQAVLAGKMREDKVDIDYSLHFDDALFALKANQLVGMHNTNIEGLLLGSNPFNGRYQPFCCPEWATKFFIDALLIEKGLNPMSIQS